MKLQIHNKILTGFNLVIVCGVGVVFLLLLFFTQVFSAHQSAVLVQLPSARSKIIPAESVYVVVTIEGKYFINKEEVEKKEVEKVLKKLLVNKTSPAFVIAADSGALHGDVVYLLELAEKNKYKALIAVNAK